jgi:nitrogen fixation-related uncharacterized protein
MTVTDILISAAILAAVLGLGALLYRFSDLRKFP